MTRTPLRFVLLCAFVSTLSTESGAIAQDERHVTRGGQRLVTKEGMRLPRRLRLDDLVREGVLEKPRGITPRDLVQDLFFEKSARPDGRPLWMTRGSTYVVFLENSGFVSVVGRLGGGDQEAQGGRNASAIRMGLTGAASVPPEGEGRLKGVAHRFIGNDPSKWQRDLPLFRAMRYRNVYPDIEMFLSGSGGQLSYGFILGPRGDERRIRFRVEGVNQLRTDATGNLVLETPLGSLVHGKPRFIEEKDGRRRELQGRFVVVGRNELRFQVASRTPGSTLAIDPTIVFSTFFGGTGQEGLLGGDLGGLETIGRGFDVASGPGGHIFVVGMSFSADFPTTVGPPMNGSSDIFVMRLDPLDVADPLKYSTLLGGSQQDRGRAITVSPAGAAFVTGFTFSTDFPVTPGTVHPVQRSGAYVARLSEAGLFELGTMISPRSGYHGNSIQFDAATGTVAEGVYVAGWVTSGEASGEGALATPGVFQGAHGGDIDGFVAKLDTALSAYSYFTFLGGARTDVIMDVDVLAGHVFVTGTTNSLNFPTTEFAAQIGHSLASSPDVDCAAAGAPRQCIESFVARIRPDASSLVYSTYLGGAATEDFARGIGVAPNGQAVVTGGARATDGSDASRIFATRLESLGGASVFEVTIEGLGFDHGEEIVVDDLGRAHITGTISQDGGAVGCEGPLGAAQTFLGGASDIFYSRINEDGEVNFFTHLGGSATDRGFAVAATGTAPENFCVHVAGSTTSADMQTVSAIQDQPASAQADMAIVSLCDFPSDPRISKNAPASVTVGEPTGYAITVINDGDEPIEVELRETFPGGFVLAPGIGCQWTLDGLNATCDVEVEGCSSTTVTIVGTALPPCPRTVTNSATIDFEGREFRDTAQVRVECAAPPPPPPNPCGNNVRDTGEECDDGDRQNGDGCDSQCRVEECGNSRVDFGEECDDGDNSNTDTCSTQCRILIDDDDTSCSATGRRCSEGRKCVRKCSFTIDCHGIPLPIWPFCLGSTEDSLLCSTNRRCVTEGSIDGDDVVIEQE